MSSFVWTLPEALVGESSKGYSGVASDEVENMIGKVSGVIPRLSEENKSAVYCV